VSVGRPDFTRAVVKLREFPFYDTVPSDTINAITFVKVKDYDWGARLVYAIITCSFRVQITVWFENPVSGVTYGYEWYWILYRNGVKILESSKKSYTLTGPGEITVTGDWVYNGVHLKTLSGIHDFTIEVYLRVTNSACSARVEDVTIEWGEYAFA